MESHPTLEEVCADLGEKAVDAFARSVDNARDDLKAYREWRPAWVAEHGERGLANWISDRLWANLLRHAEDVPGMDLIEKGVTREVVIDKYRFRVKRHDEEGNVASYETPTFLEFVEQPQGQLKGLEEVRVIAGYDWAKDTRGIGPAVMSLRDGKNNVLWKEQLPSASGEAEGATPLPAQPSPSGPTVYVAEDVGQQAKEPTEGE